MSGDVVAVILVTPTEARAARRQVENALDLAGWPWSARLSAWLDALITIEEANAPSRLA